MRALLLAALPACTFFAVTPPAEPPAPPGDCSTSYVAPGLDLAGTIVSGAVAIIAGYVALEASGSGCHGDDCGAAAGAGFVVAVPATAATIVYGIATSRGHHAVDRCRRLRHMEP